VEEVSRFSANGAYLARTRLAAVNLLRTCP